MTADTETEAVSSPLPRSRGRWATRGQKLTIIGLAFAGGFGLLILSNWLPAGKTPDEKPDLRISGPGLPLKIPAEVKPVPAPPPPMPTAPPSLQTVTAPVFAPPNLSRALDAPIFSYAAGSATSDPTAKAGHRGAGAVDLTGSPATAAASDDPLSASLRPSDIGAPAKASLLKNPSLTIPVGTIIPCSLQTALNSQLPGFVTCVVPAEVRGATGTVTLLDRGTQIFGEIRSGLRQGQDRLMILWVRARTPDNVIISLHSPAADELGAAGAPGQVDQHFWQRFGAALLFSVIEAAPQIAASALQNGSNNSYTSLYSPSQQLAGTILNQTINIPPTLIKNIGESVTVFVARDLDFSGVYALRTKE